MRKQIITLKFNPNLYVGKDLRDGLSAVVKIGDCIWVAGDETANLERIYLTKDDIFAKHESFPIAKYIDLPEIDAEIDIEGLDYQGHYLWFTGSHSLKRKRARPDETDQLKEIKRLSKVEREPNRYVVGRIPLVKNIDTGVLELRKSCPNPDHPQRTLFAGIIPLTENANELYEILQKDEHLKDFFAIPGKDNGFDIEGLAIYHDRMFLGLRGPVLRGWAIILEIELETDSETKLKIKKNKEKKYKKHFIYLGGMGIRELCVEGENMLILAGATMDLSATIAVFRWKNAFTHDENELVKATEVEKLFEVPHGFGDNMGKDKAEGMTLWNKNEVLIVFDSPADIRKTMLSEVMADVFSLVP